MTLPLMSCVDPCGNGIISDVPSPNGKQHAIVFERDCGATTDFSYQVSILNSGQQIKNRAGNTFVADRNHGATKSMYVKVRWTGPQKLVISYPADARLFRHEERVDDI